MCELCGVGGLGVVEVVDVPFAALVPLCPVLGARCSLLGARCSVLGARCSVGVQVRTVHWCGMSRVPSREGPTTYHVRIVQCFTRGSLDTACL